MQTQKQTIKNLILVALLFLNSFSFGLVQESQEMKDLLNYLVPDTLVVFDLDNTLVHPAQTLGSDQWFEHRVHFHLASGVKQEEAVQRAVSDWVDINRHTKVLPVESSTPKLVSNLQKQGIRTLGLTARPASFTEKSLDQLRSIGITLNRNPVTAFDFWIPGFSEAYFSEGIVSVGSSNKGLVLRAFLQKTGINPRRIVYFDDKAKHVQALEVAFANSGIEYFGFRYGAADADVAAFDAELADCAYKMFSVRGKLLSDSQAKKLVEAGCFL